MSQLKAIDVARYFLTKDPYGQVFNTIVSADNWYDYNGSAVYEGCIRLCCMLHMAQNLYLAKYGEKLFSDDMYAYPFGAVVPEVVENYLELLKERDQNIQFDYSEIEKALSED